MSEKLLQGLKYQSTLQALIFYACVGVNLVCALASWPAVWLTKINVISVTFLYFYTISSVSDMRV